MRGYLIVNGKQVTPIEHTGDGYIYPTDYQHLIPDGVSIQMFNIQQHGAVYCFKNQLKSWGQLVDWAGYCHSHVILGVYDATREPAPLISTQDGTVVDLSPEVVV